MNRAGLQHNIARAGFVLLCTAALCFPFSVAAFNAALAGCLATGLLSGDYLQGVRRAWKEERALCIAWLAYLLMFPLGLLWSLDVRWGLSIIGHQWFWLLLPLVAQLLMDTARRRVFFLALGTGLVLHLLLCLAQFGGAQFPELIPNGGSSSDNPTGYIGHTSFGLVYGCWAAYLLLASLHLAGWQRWATRLLALWAVGMIFLTAGRGGYLVVAVVLLLTLWKMLRASALLKTAAAAAVLLLIAGAIAFGPGKARVLQSWHSMKQVEKGNLENREARWSMWYVATLAWRQHMPLGVGTGGFRIASAAIRAQHPDLYLATTTLTQPHNVFFQALARWGPLGVLIVVLLFAMWIRRGWKGDWHADPALGMAALSGIALCIQGLTEPSLEEHFPAGLALMLLGAGLAALHAGKRTVEEEPS